MKQKPRINKLKNLNRKKLIKVFVVFGFITSLASCMFLSTNYTVYPSKAYYGLDENSSLSLINSSEITERRKLIDDNPSLDSIELSNESKINQAFRINCIDLNKIMFDIDNNDIKTGVIKLELKDESDKIIFSEEKELSQIQQIEIEVPDQHYDRRSNFELSVEVLGIGDDEKVTLYTCTYNDGSLKINGETSEGVLLMNLEGSLNVYKSKSLLISIFICILLLCYVVKLFLLDEKRILSKVDVILDFSKRKVRIFVWELLAFLALLYVFLKLYCSYKYVQSINLVYMTLFIFITALFITLILYCICKNKHRIEIIFVLIAIPVGLSYAFLIMPNCVPDENVHFAKAYLTSLGNFTSENKVNFPTQYTDFPFSDYRAMLNGIFTPTNYQDVYTNHNATGYSVILYVFSAIPLFISRILGAPIYFAYYLGRCANLFIMILAGYYAIKITPIGKFVFLIYLFNPMFFHQGASYSSDSLINSAIIFAVAHFLMMKMNKKITNRDIYIVFAIIAFIVTVKYVYLPLCGMYFLLYKEIFIFNKKQWISFAKALLSAVVLIAVFKALTYNATTLLGHKIYLENSGVNSSEQIKFLLSSPKNFLVMLRETIKVQGEFYVNSFIGIFGWLAVQINNLSYYVFVFLLVLSPLIVEEKKLKLLERGWLIFIAVATSILVILGLYLEWTTVGTYVTQGVQGRYFIPTIIFAFIALCGHKKVIIKRPIALYVLGIFVIQGFALLDILKYFAG